FVRSCLHLRTHGLCLGHGLAALCHHFSAHLACVALFPTVGLLRRLTQVGGSIRMSAEIVKEKAPGLSGLPRLRRRHVTWLRARRWLGRGVGMAVLFGGAVLFAAPLF